MAIVFYDLAGRDGRNFSPYCWRTRMALAHKGLAPDCRDTAFTAIPGIADGEFKTVPVIDDDGERVVDSAAIADYLEARYPDAPSLFGGDTARAMCKFVHSWTNSVVHAGLARMIVKDIFDHLCAEDRDYFRASREKIFGQSLEATQADREDRLPAFRDSLYPLRLTVRGQAFLGGEQPNYADYIVFGAFQWARTISDFRLLADDDPVFAWFQRCGDLYDGLGRKAPGYY